MIDVLSKKIKKIKKFTKFERLLCFVDTSQRENILNGESITPLEFLVRLTIFTNLVFHQPRSRAGICEEKSRQWWVAIPVSFLLKMFSSHRVRPLDGRHTIFHSEIADLASE